MSVQCYFHSEMILLNFQFKSTTHNGTRQNGGCVSNSNDWKIAEVHLYDFMVSHVCSAVIRIITVAVGLTRFSVQNYNYSVFVSFYHETSLYMNNFCSLDSV